MKRFIIAAALLACVFTAAAPDESRAEAGRETERIEISTEVLKDIMAIPEKSIPPVLLRKAEAVAVIPSVYKLGFVFGGRFGKGVAAVRSADGSWENPFFITLASGSFGWQIGVQSIDLILVFKNRKNVDDIKKNNLTLGVDAAVAAGPVGRKTEASTDIKLNSEIYSYSRSRGLFAGISLEGGILQVDHKATYNFYGVPIYKLNEAEDIPAAARTFKQTLEDNLHR